MHVGQLIKGFGVELARGRPGTAITGVWDDSRRISDGNLFIARSGAADDGARYIADAVDRGAAAVLASPGVDVPAGVSVLIADDVNAITPHLAERFHGNPSRRLRLIGVTGTNGKTTTVWMIRHLLNAGDSGGGRCGLISTIEVDTGGGVPRSAALTTPGACELSAILAAMVANGCVSCAMECSSHALAQGRCDALSFDVAVFTNLSGDHLDYHASMEAYAASKGKLFAMLGAGGRAVINADDPAGGVMMASCRAAATWYGLGESAAIVRADATGSVVRVGHGADAVEARLPLIGRHNVYNLLAAGHAIGSFAGLAAAVSTLPHVPGRLERVTADAAPLTVLVDYAHTDDALRNVLEALRPLVPGGARLHVLFGCGGDRDRTKRPRMAQVACELADAVVITSDNPRTEDPQAIIDDIVRGVPPTHRDRVACMVDRGAAIDHIVERAGASGRGDIVLLAGKGHEDYQVIGDRRLAFDDRVAARHAVERRGIETR